MRRLSVLLLLLLLLTGCAPSLPEKRSSFSFDYFDTVLEISGYEEEEAVFTENCRAAEALAAEYHKLCDIYHPCDTGVSALNAAAGKHPVQIDQRLFDLLSFAKETGLETGSACNIAFGSVLSLWHAGREGNFLPEEAALREAAKHTALSDLILDPEQKTAFLADPLMQLDLGAAAKGYVTGQMAELLRKRGAEGYLINFGGNVQTVGNRPDGTPFLAGVQDPDGEGLAATVSLSDCALVTSGDYQRGYTVNGKWYHHIIDPDTLYPAAGFSSVSVLHPDSGTADILSTALFTATPAEGRELLQKFPEAEVLWITTEGERVQTGGFVLTE